MYDSYGVTVSIPFLPSHPGEGPGPLPFTDPPQVHLSVGHEDQPIIHKITMDTGSVGIALSTEKIPGYSALKASGTPGWIYLSSSHRLWVGYWVTVDITFHDLEMQSLATATVPVLGVEHELIGSRYANGPTDPSAHLPPAPPEIKYMGVGFGREQDHQPQGTPDKNPFLNITRVGSMQVAPQTMCKGYIIKESGVDLGLTAANTQGFSRAKLQQNTEYASQYDWHAMPMAVTVGPTKSSTGTVLVDTGVGQMYITVPDDFPNASADGTEITVSFPTTPTAQSYSFTVGESDNPLQPARVIPVPNHGPTFVNTGRHFLRGFHFLFDAVEGYAGVRPVKASPT